MRTGMLALSVVMVVTSLYAAPPATAVPVAGDVFVDRAAETGLDFVHFNGMSGEYYYVEIFGPGAALFDYDNDGDLDVYLLQGTMLGTGKPYTAATFPPASGPPYLDRLYRNDLDAKGGLRFTDVTQPSGIVSTSYGMGAAAGDYDGDGFIDLYVTNYGPNMLLHNNGDGTFSDATAASGTAEERWSSSAAFLDFDADGHLDLFVANYVTFSVNQKPCVTATGSREYCGPASFRSIPDRLFRNRGDGTFEDVTAKAGIARAFGSALGVISADFDGDGRVDIFVANDGQANQLWINKGKGTFADTALLAGCALNADGKPEASMGVDFGDFDGDGDEDLFLAHLNDETNTLYINDGKGWFDDHTYDAGLGFASRNFTGFGTSWIDYDNDGWLDLFVANGAIKSLQEQVRAGSRFPLAQPNHLYRNLGDGRFDEVSARAGKAFELLEVSRGAAFGDVDNDGDVDVLVSNNSAPPRLLVNEVGNKRHWLGVRVVGADGRGDVLGARVELVRPDGSSLWRRVRTASSYLSSNDPRVLFGLGADKAVKAVRVHWPGGAVEQWPVSEIDRYMTLRRGSAKGPK